jgi:hypothetical protein
MSSIDDDLAGARVRPSGATVWLADEAGSAGDQHLRAGQVIGRGCITQASSQGLDVVAAAEHDGRGRRRPWRRRATSAVTTAPAPTMAPWPTSHAGHEHGADADIGVGLDDQSGRSAGRWR